MKEDFCLSNSGLALIIHPAIPPSEPVVSLTRPFPAINT